MHEVSDYPRKILKTNRKGSPGKTHFDELVMLYEVLEYDSGKGW
jgi:hypothetical protein